MFHRQPWMQRAGEYPSSDEEYFGLLARAVFSAGLGPRVVEARWPALEQAFHGLRPAEVAAMDESDVARLLSDPAVIRNRRKIEAVVANATTYLDVTRDEGSFHAYLQRLSAERSFGGLVDEVSGRFAHLGPTSAALFLFSAGWREDPVDGQPGDGSVVSEQPDLAAGPDEAPVPASSDGKPARSRRERVPASRPGAGRRSESSGQPPKERPADGDEVVVVPESLVGMEAAVGAEAPLGAEPSTGEVLATASPA